MNELNIHWTPGLTVTCLPLLAGVAVVNNSGSSFTITSANLADTDTVRYTIIGD